VPRATASAIGAGNMVARATALTTDDGGLITRDTIWATST